MLPVLPVREAASVTAAAALVITNRYHPAVFGLAAGVPVVALANDAYSDIRLAGALGNWGLGDWALPQPSLSPGGVDEAVLEAWNRRDEIRRHLDGLRPGFERSPGDMVGCRGRLYCVAAWAATPGLKTRQPLRAVDILGPARPRNKGNCSAP